MLLTITSVGANAPKVQAEETEETVTITFIDNTEEKWVGNDNAVIELVDNTQGHDKYDMEKVDDHTWSVTVPARAYNITFNRYDADKKNLWNSWSAGGRDGKVTYEALSAAHGAWKEEKASFQEGDTIYLDTKEFTDWEQDSASFYINCTTATKKENNGQDINIESANKEQYQIAQLTKEEDGIYSYTFTKEDSEKKINGVRFWRGNDTTLWNDSILMTAEDYIGGKNCVKVKGWNEIGELVYYEGIIDKEKDTDEDGLLDYLEKELGTDMHKVDTDGDGLSDYYEVVYAYNPLKKDTDDNQILDYDEDYDEDGLSNKDEQRYKTEMGLSDTDGEGLNDFEEVKTYETNPLVEDTDGDGLSDYDEIKIGLDPLSKDSNQDGILDSEEKIKQTMEVKCEEEEIPGAITGVTLQINATGNIEETTLVYDDYHDGAYTSEVAGMIGVPFEFETESDFDEATITFHYDSKKLGNTKEDNLRVMWYDEKNDKFEIMEDSIIDKKNHTVSYTTTHFCTFLVVDRSVWLDTWRNAISYGRGKDEKETFYDIGFVIDTSGSMRYERQMEITKEAAEKFIDAMKGQDRASIVGYDQIASVYQNFTTDKEKLKKAIHSLESDGYTFVEAGIKRSLALFQLEEENANEKIMILICDGDVYYSKETLEQVKNLGIKIYTVLINSTSGKKELMDISNETGGKFFYATNSSEVINSLSKIQRETLDEIDTTDTDGDGLYDVLETKGMIASNGHYYYSNPNMNDTDRDGISDKEEMGIMMVQNINGSPQTIFSLKGNPSSKDTDKDLDPDGIDPNNKKFQLNGYFANKLEELNDLAQDYLSDYETTVKKKKLTRSTDKWLTYMYLRNKNDDYGSKRWMAIGGKTDTKFVKYVREANSGLDKFFSQQKYIYANAKGDKIDLYHMAATETAHIYESSYKDGKGEDKWIYKAGYQLMPEKILDQLSGWAGDLQTYVVEIQKKDSEKKYKNFKVLFEQYFLLTNTSFSSYDLYADVDAYNLYNLEKKQTISKAFKSYYSKGYKKRYTSFTYKMSEKRIKNRVYQFTKTKYLGRIPWPLYGKNFVLNKEQSKAARDAFSDYIITERNKENKKIKKN